MLGAVRNQYKDMGMGIMCKPPVEIKLPAHVMYTVVKDSRIDTKL